MFTFRNYIRSIAMAAGLVAGTSAVANEQNAEQDPKLSRSAYIALQRDAELGELNLGVKVNRDGTVRLWGHELSKTQISKAETLLKRIPGISKVVHDSQEAVAVDPLIAQVRDGMNKPAPVVVREPVREEVKVDLTPPRPVDKVEKRVTTVSKPPIELVPPGVAGTVQIPTARLLDPISETNELSSSVEKIRRSDSRYRDLEIDVTESRLTIRGYISDSTYVWELARKLNDLPGDRQVVVGRIQLK